MTMFYKFFKLDVWFTVSTHNTTVMDISLTYRRDTHLAAVYFGNEAPNMFRIYVDATLVDLKQQLDEVNRCCNNKNDDRTVTSVEYRKPSLRSNGSVAFSNMQLQNDNDVRNMFSIYSQYSTKGPIELDAKLTRSVDAILANLKHPDDEDCTVNLADP
jgi:pyruvate-formate lyase-activating enzyme